MIQVLGCSLITFTHPGGLILGNFRIDKAGWLRPRAENFHRLGKAWVGLDSVVERAATNAENSARLFESNESF